MESNGASVTDGLGIGAAGPVDVMVIDVEGLEWPILRGFTIAKWRPKLVIVEIQEKQARCDL